MHATVTRIVFALVAIILLVVGIPKILNMNQNNNNPPSNIQGKPVSQDDQEEQDFRLELSPDSPSGQQGPARNMQTILVKFHVNPKKPLQIKEAVVTIESSALLSEIRIVDKTGRQLLGESSSAHNSGTSCHSISLNITVITDTEFIVTARVNAPKDLQNPRRPVRVSVEVLKWSVHPEELFFMAIGPTDRSIKLSLASDSPTGYLGAADKEYEILRATMYIEVKRPSDAIIIGTIALQYIEGNAVVNNPNINFEAVKAADNRKMNIAQYWPQVNQAFMPPNVGQASFCPLYEHDEKSGRMVVLGSALYQNHYELTVKGSIFPLKGKKCNLRLKLMIVASDGIEASVESNTLTFDDNS